ncbi:BA14K family protein [Rhizobiales bacterium Sp-1]|uniref:Lectin-like protein BA14k n=2 Tax=Segnochrobactrum spirostomi TaxID=2608987 RepID=A0A6A7Y426_9HYPH|nr:BA14K family protein [Segnochrobactrum spirostomi]
MALAPQAAAPGVVYVVPTRQPRPDPDDIGPKASDAIGPPPPAQGPVNYVTPPTVVQVPAYYGSGSDGGAVTPSYAPAYGATSYGGQAYGGQAYGDGQGYGAQGADGAYGGGGQAVDPNAPAVASPQNYVAATPPAPWSAGWYSYCAGRYPSFNPQTGNYTTNDGKTYFCR